MKKDNRSYYDEFSGWYEKERHRGYHALLDDLEVDLISDLAVGADVLEVGCGTGLLLRRIHDKARSAVGIDISQGMLKQAQQRGLKVLQGDATALPFSDQSFDLVYSFKVLAHIEDIEQAMHEMARVTRPGGRLILEFYNPFSLRYLVKRLGGPQKISRKTNEGAVFTRWDDPFAVKKLLTPDLKLIDFAGVRVFTPVAALHRVPGLHTLLRKMEFAGRDSLLKYTGGFLVAIIEKQS